MTLDVQITLVLPLLLAFADYPQACGEPLTQRVEHAYATNSQDNTKIHYVSVGAGPLVVFLHGFPDFWYSWAHQMEHLSSAYRCVALDLRGYNRSDKPDGIENYDMSLLVKDVLCVIDACGAKQVALVGHDWGGPLPGPLPCASQATSID